MEIVEVVLQGVRGSPALSRWSLAVPPAGGVVVLPVGERDGLVMRAAYELLAGIVDDSRIVAALENGAEAHRAGVVVAGRDQRRYRVLWDLKAGRRALQVQNGDKYDVLTTTQSEIQQALTATVGFPQSDALREIFFSFAEDLPSKRRDVVVDDKRGAAKVKSASDKPLPPGFDLAAPAKSTSDKPLPPGFDFDSGPPQSKWAGRPEGELRARLAEIASARTGVVDVSALEFELDGLQKKAFELEGKKKPLVDADRVVESLSAQMQALAHLDALPADFLDQAATLQKHQAEHASGIERLRGERARLVETADHLSDEVSGLRQRGGPRPFVAAQNDPFVKYGVAGGVGAIAIALFGGFAVDGLRYLALLDIPAFGVAVFGGIRLLTGLEEGASVRMKLARLDREQKALDERNAIDKEQMQRLLERAQVKLEDLGEVQAQYRRRDDVRAQREAAVQHLATLRESGDLQSLATELEHTTARMRDIEEALAQAGSRDPGGASALDAEQREIEAILRGEAPATTDKKPSLDDLFGPSSPKSEPVETTAGGTVVAVDVGQRMVRLASDLLVATLDDTCTRLAPRTSQMVNALTDRRYSEVRFGPKAEVSVVDAAAGEPIAFGLLPPGDRDLVSLALRLAVVEAYTRANPGVNRLPLVFDGTFDAFPAERAAMFARVLQFVGQGTQVVCVTGRPQLAAVGTTVSAQ